MIPAAVITVGVVLALAGVLVIVAARLINSPQKPPKATPTPSPKIAHVEATPSATPSLAPNETPASSSATPTPAQFVPEIQVVYYGLAGEKMGYFVTNKEMQKYTARGSSALNAYKGQVLFEDGSYEMNFDFREMKDPKVVMKTDDILINGVLPAIGDFRRNEKTGMLYLIFHTVGSNPKLQVNIADVLYRVDLYYGRVRRVFTHQLYGNLAQKGPMHIESIWHDDYAILKIDNCITCTNKDPYHWAIVNVNTYNSRYLGTVTDIREDVVKGNVNYRQLVAVKESCSAGETGCDELGEKTVYKPSAQSMSQKLP